MKYIRTKEGKIIDIDKRYQWHLKNGWINKRIKDKETFIKISHHNILKQSNTIEELCDCFVIIDKFGERKILEYSFNYIKQYELKGFKKTVYGAIWTDKGLIFVAKMNKNGVLEVL